MRCVCMCIYVVNKNEVSILQLNPRIYLIFFKIVWPFGKYIIFKEIWQFENIDLHKLDLIHLCF